MNETIAKFIANMIRTRLDYLYDMEQAEGRSAYLTGRIEGTLLLMRDICDYLQGEGVVQAEVFLREALPV